MFGTTTLQPYAEYSVAGARRICTITPGIKLAYYKQDFTQFADNGKTVGNLNGAPSVKHVAEYHSWLPSIDAHYARAALLVGVRPVRQGPEHSAVERLRRQERAGRRRCPSRFSPTPYQFGSVWKSRRATLDVDYYHINFQSDYSSTIDPVTGDTLYFLNGESITQGVEAESTILVGGGLAVYLNGDEGHGEVHRHRPLGAERAEATPRRSALTYNLGSWNVGFFSKRVGQMYNDNGSIHQAIPIDPFNITNLFFNYTLQGIVEVVAVDGSGWRSTT